MAGRMALMIRMRPSDLLGFRGSELERFVLDAMVLSEVASELEHARPPKSTKELVKRKRAKWRAPRGMIA